LEKPITERGVMAGEHDMYALMAETASLQRDGEALRSYAPEIEKLAERSGHDLYLCIANRAWGIAHLLAAEFEQAEHALNRALAIAMEMGGNWQIGRSLYELGKLERARENPAAARIKYSLAAEAFEALGATPFVNESRSALEALDLEP
jgi:hypothetical protein